MLSLVPDSLAVSDDRSRTFIPDLPLSLESPNLSVVVLAYRSADTLPDFVQSLKNLLEENDPDWEMILVGNFIEDSGDPTPDVVRRLADAHAKIRALTEVKRGMMGWDMRSGLKAANGKVIAVIDGDGQMPAEDVVRVYRLLIENGLDFAKTFRVQRDDGPYRKIISGVYNLLFGILFPGMGCRDINSKPKLMTRAAYRKLNLTSNGWFIDAEIMIQARRFGFKIGEIETVFHEIDSRPSFVRPLSILEFMANLIWFRILEFFRSSKN